MLMQTIVCIVIISMIFVNVESMDSPYWKANKTRPLKGQKNNKLPVKRNNTSKNIVATNEEALKCFSERIEPVPSVKVDKAAIETFQKKVIELFKLTFEENKGAWEKKLGTLKVIDMYGCNECTATLKLTISSQIETEYNKEMVESSFLEKYEQLCFTLESGTGVKVMEKFSDNNSFFYLFDWSFTLKENNACIERISHLKQAINLALQFAKKPSEK